MFASQQNKPKTCLGKQHTHRWMDSVEKLRNNAAHIDQERVL
jgi:hypothetical protein